MPDRKINLPLVLNTLFLLGLVAVIVVSMIVFRPQPEEPSPFGEEGKGEFMIGPGQILTPSSILNDKSKYAEERLVVRGRVAKSPVVCQRQECPEEDSCCGCPRERDLVMSDSGIALKAKSKQSLKLVSVSNEPLCERRPGSCDYDCPGFNEGAIYDVVGEFIADTPPPGWNLSLNFYFKVNNQELVKSVSFTDSAGNLFREIIQAISKPKTSGQYVLQ